MWLKFDTGYRMLATHAIKERESLKFKDIRYGISANFGMLSKGKGKSWNISKFWECQIIFILFRNMEKYVSYRKFGDFMLGYRIFFFMFLLFFLCMKLVS